MTYKTKNTTFVIAFAAMMLALPLSTGNAFAASGGDGVINPTCGITEPALDLDVGAISKGADGTQLETRIATSGSESGTFEVKLDDWVGAGTVSENTLLVESAVADTDVITINGLTYQGVTTNSAAGDFEVVASDITTAANLVTTINGDGRTGITEATVAVVASSFDNAVFIRSDIVGDTIPNNVDIAQTAGSGTLNVQTAGGTLTGGEAAGVKHMDAEDTHYAITTDETTVSNGYSAKTPLSANAVNKVLSTTTDPGDDDILFYLHISGVDTSATGSIQFTGVAATDSIVVGDTTLVAFNGVTSDPGQFDISGDNDADAAAFEAKLDAVSQQFTTITTTDTVAITVINPGEVGNGLTLTDSGSGTTLTAFSGGDDNLENLPFNGAMTTTITYGTRC